MICEVQIPVPQPHLAAPQQVTNHLFQHYRRRKNNHDCRIFSGIAIKKYLNVSWFSLFMCIFFKAAKENTQSCWQELFWELKSEFFFALFQ